MVPSIKRPPLPKWFMFKMAGSLIGLWLGLVWQFEIDLASPRLVGCSGALICFQGFLTVLALRTHRETATPGCLVFVGLTLGCILLAAAGCLSWLAGLRGGFLSDWAFFLFSILLIAGPFVSSLVFFQAYYHQVYLARKLYRDLGFVHETNRMPGGGKELFISHLQPDGLLAEAGFRVGDVVLTSDGFTGFFIALEKARGAAPLTITVARSGTAIPYHDPTPLPDRPKEQLTVLVPPKEYSVLLEEELGFRCEVDYLQEAGRWVGVLTITHIKRGGLFEQIGFRERDIVLNGGGVPHFIGRLAQARGREHSVVVVPWIDPPDVYDRPVRELTLHLPPKGASGELTSVPYHVSRTELELEQDLGFGLGWEWLPVNGKWQGIQTIEQLVPDGILARAGFREKDIILPESIPAMRRFPQSWERARGGEPISVRVASWVEPPTLHERPRHVLTVRVPPCEN